MPLCGRIFLGAQSPDVIVHRIWARKDYAHEVRTSGQFLAKEWTLPFPEFLMWCQAPLENLTGCLDPNFPFHEEKIFSDKNLETQPNCVDSFNNATDPFAPPFFDFLLGLSSASTCLRKHFLPHVHPV